jgi:hypothetical protein
LGFIGTPPVQEPTPSGWSECKGAGSLRWVEIKRFAIPKTDPGLPSSDPNYKCWGYPTLTAGTNQRMWLQLRIQDDPLQGDNPHVYVIAAWDPESPTTDCGTTGDITSCPRVCRVDVTDPTVTIGNVMETQKGHLICSVHDANYRLWVIRGGSKP